MAGYSEIEKEVTGNTINERGVCCCATCQQAMDRGRRNSSHNELTQIEAKNLQSTVIGATGSTVPTGAIGATGSTVPTGAIVPKTYIPVDISPKAKLFICETPEPGKTIDFVRVIDPFHLQFTILEGTQVVFGEYNYRIVEDFKSELPKNLPVSPIKITLPAGTRIRTSNKIPISLADSLQVEVSLDGPFIIKSGTKLQQPTTLKRIIAGEDSEVTLVR